MARRWRVASNGPASAPIAAAHLAPIPGAPALVLASGSAIRAQILAQAGVAFAVDPAPIDEAALRDGLAAEGADSAQIAEALAEAKALAVARRHPGALILGCDQTLDCDGRRYDKPADRAEAKAQLRALAGKTHRLHAALVLVRDGRRIWHHIGRADLTMRRLSEEFLDRYLDHAGEDVMRSVGAYQLEGLGAQLFERIAGDHFTILGLPLLPLLAILREHGAVPR